MDKNNMKSQMISKLFSFKGIKQLKILSLGKCNLKALHEPYVEVNNGGHI
jgi:hypothetical protein